MEANNSETNNIAKHNLNNIYFYLTEGCNLNCRHCWISPHFQKAGQSFPALDFGLFCHIIEQGMEMGVRRVKLTGGEPLLHPEIGKIIGFLNKKEIALAIETNGLLCDKDTVSLIAENPRSFVSVSLDSPQRDLHEWIRGVKGSFDNTLRGINNLVTVALRPQIIMTLMKRNSAQIEEMVSFAEEIGASSVKLNIIMPTGRGEDFHNNDEVIAVADLIETGRWVEEVLAPDSKIPVYFDHPIAFRPLSRMFAGGTGNCSCCGIKGIIGVLPDGSYALCGIGSSVKELVFGHAAEERLADVWGNNQILRQIREELPRKLEGVCGECLMNDACLGSCIAQNYYRSGSLWKPFWFCEEAHRLGIFPASRLIEGTHIS